MSNFSNAESIVNSNYTDYEDSEHLARMTEAQVHATLALVEAQETANLIAFLNWADEASKYVPQAEYVDVINQVKERIK